MEQALAKRHVTHKSIGYKCSQPWKQNVDTCDIAHATLASRQNEFIRNVRGLNPDRLELTMITPSTATPSTAAITRRLDYATPMDLTINPDLPPPPSTPQADT